MADLAFYRHSTFGDTMEQFENFRLSMEDPAHVVPAEDDRQLLLARDAQKPEGGPISM